MDVNNTPGNLFLQTLFQDYCRRMAGINSNNICNNNNNNTPVATTTTSTTGGWLQQTMPVHGTVPKSTNQQSNQLINGSGGGRAAAEQSNLPLFGATAAAATVSLSQQQTNLTTINEDDKQGLLEATATMAFQPTKKLPPQQISNNNDGQRWTVLNEQQYNENGKNEFEQQQLDSPGRMLASKEITSKVQY